MAKNHFKKGDYITSEDNKKRFRLEDSATLKNSYYIVHAYDILNKRECFLKFTTLDSNGVDRINLERESKFKFYYPYLEHVYELFTGIDPDNDKIVGVSVEWIEGKDLSYARKNLQLRTGRPAEENGLTEEEAERIIFRQIMQFLYGINYYLNYAKPSYFHRDLKPSNIMVTNAENGDGDIKIIDFDYSHISGSVDTLNLYGHNPPFSPGYTSPRVLAKRKSLELADEIDEIYSAGRVIFFWLNGEDYYTYTEWRGTQSPCNIQYCMDDNLGYGLDMSRFKDAKYREKKYEKLMLILKKMCAKPETGEGYSSISAVLIDMKQFLTEYCGSSQKAYEDYFGLNKMPFLQNNSNKDDCNVPLVVYEEADSLNGKQGHPLYEYSMRDIPYDGSTMLTVYNRKGNIYYIPSEGTILTNREEDNNYIVYDEDTFQNGKRIIKIFIR